MYNGEHCYTLLQSSPLQVVRREIFFWNKKSFIGGGRKYEGNFYLVEIDGLLTDLPSQVDELMFVLS